MVAAFVLPCSCIAEPPEVLIESYRVLEERLKERKASTKSWAELSEDESDIGAIARSGNLTLYRDMSEADPDQQPNVVGFGLKALQQHSQREAYLRAIRAMSRIGDLVHGGSEEISTIAFEKRSDEDQLMALNMLRDLSFRVDSLRSSVLRRFSTKVIHSWWEQNADAPMLPQLMSLLLETLILNCESAGLEVTKSMTRELENLYAIPGYPRLVYVCHASQDSKSFHATLVKVLRDELLDSVFLRAVVEARWRYITDKIDLAALAVSDEHRLRLQKLLAEQDAEK